MPSRLRIYVLIGRWIRELHLCAGLFVSPFVLVFAVSAILLNHTCEPWTIASKPTVETRLGIELPDTTDDLDFAQSIMRQVDVVGEVEFFRYQPEQTSLEIPVMRPGWQIRITVDREQRMAKIERRRTSFWDRLHYLHKLPGPHLAGFRGNWVFTRLWRWLADLTVCLVLLVSLTGIFLWSLWKAQRRLGLILIGTGVLTFALLVLALVL